MSGPGTQRLFGDAEAIVGRAQCGPGCRPLAGQSHRYPGEHRMIHATNCPRRLQLDRELAQLPAEHWIINEELLDETPVPSEPNPARPARAGEDPPR